MLFYRKKNFLNLRMAFAISRLLNCFMKKNQVLLLAFSLFASSCYTQTTRRIDSLINLLKTQGEDSNKVNTLNALSRQVAAGKNITDAQKYAEEALSLAEKTGFKKGISNAHISMGNVFQVKGSIASSQNKYPEALQNFLKALEIFEANNAIREMGMSNRNVALIYQKMGNYAEAFKYYYNSFNLVKQADDKRMIAMLYNDLGFAYENLGNTTEALKNFEASIKTYEEMGDRARMVNRYFNIAFLYERLGNHAETIKNYKIALKISEEIGTKSGIATSYSNIADNYHIQGLAETDQIRREQKFKESLNGYFEALKILKEINEELNIAICYTGIGAVYFELKEYAKAKQYLDTGLVGYKKVSVDPNQDMYQALTYYLRDNYELQAKVDSATGNWEGAYTNHKLFLLHRDSLVNEENSNKITEIRMQFGFDKKEDSLKYQQALTDEKLKQQQLLASQQRQSLLLKEKEVALLNNEKLLLNKEKEVRDLQLQNNATELAIQKTESEKKQDQVLLLNKENDIQTLQIKKQKQFRNYLLTGFALLILTTFFAYNSYRTRQQLKVQKLRNKIASDLHDDVGSTLSSISMFSQMAQQQSKETIPLLESIGDYSRKMLDAMADIVWTINPENDQFEQIILRMRNFAYDLLGTKNIEFEFDADEDVTNMKLSMDVRKNIYLIFKEATNNMAKYSGADQASFSIKNEKNNLIMLIHDNGKGFNTLQATNGNGLKNMRKRAEEMGADLRIESGLGKGTTIELSIAV